MAQVLPAFSRRIQPRGYQHPSMPFRINWNHPIARNLIGYFPISHSPMNIANGNVMSLASGTSPVRTSGLYGAMISFDGTAQAAGLGGGYSNNDPILQRSGGAYWSIATLCSVLVTGGPTSGSPLYGERATAGNDIIKFCYNDTGGTTHQFESTLRNTAGDLSQVRSAINQNDGLFHYWVNTKNGNGGGGNQIIYRDGVVNGTPGDWAFPDTYTNSGMNGVVGATDNQDTSGSFPGSIVYSAVWNRVLSPDEIKFLFLNPFCLVMSEEMPVLRQAQAGGATVFNFPGWGSPAFKNIPIGY